VKFSSPKNQAQPVAPVEASVNDTLRGAGPVAGLLVLLENATIGAAAVARPGSITQQTTIKNNFFKHDIVSPFSGYVAMMRYSLQYIIRHTFVSSMTVDQYLPHNIPYGIFNDTSLPIVCIFID
jgi:hypothetical protein